MEKFNRTENMKQIIEDYLLVLQKLHMEWRNESNPIEKAQLTKIEDQMARIEIDLRVYQRKKLMNWYLNAGKEDYEREIDGVIKQSEKEHKMNM